MNVLIRIIRTELRLLFYTPIAWILLAAFWLQATFAFINIFEQAFIAEASTKPWQELTKSILVNFAATQFISDEATSFFPQIVQYFYLYISLLTMHLMSRELESGSITLLYSSPIAKWQLIGGKFLSIILYGLTFIITLFIFCLLTDHFIEGFDYTIVPTSLLGVFLIMGLYGAIGLFISSLTANQTTAAVITITALSAWNNIDMIQSLKWLSINQALESFWQGHLLLSDICYFVIMTLLFLGLSIIRLQHLLKRQPLPITITQYFIFVIAILILSFMTSRNSLSNRRVQYEIQKPKITFIKNHGARTHNYKNYSLFSNTLTTRIFKVNSHSLKKKIPRDIHLLIISDIQEPLTQEEQTHLNAYLEQGGDAWIFGEPGKQQIINSIVTPLGVEFMSGRLVKAQKESSHDAFDASATGILKQKFNKALTLSGATGLSYTTDKGFMVQPLFVSPSDGWNELETTEFNNETNVTFHAEAGEVKQSYPVALSLTRKISDYSEQEILIFGDADCLNNKQMCYKNEYIIELFLQKSITKKQLQQTKEAISAKKPSKDQILADREEQLKVTLKELDRYRIILGFTVPLLSCLMALIIWIRRKNR